MTLKRFLKIRVKNRLFRSIFLLHKLYFSMRLSECKNEKNLKVISLEIEDKDLLRRLQEIGVKVGKNIRFVKKSKISGCVLIEVLGSVFMLDNYIAKGIECNG